MAISDPGRGLVRRLGVTAAALLAFAAEVGTEIVIVGACVSWVTVIVLVETLPAASVAVIVITLMPGVRAIAADQLLVPVAVPVAPVAAFDQVIDERPPASAAVPDTVTLDVAVL